MKDLVEIASMLIGVALIVALVARSKQTAEVIQAGTEGLGGLIKVATLQGQAYY